MKDKENTLWGSEICGNCHLPKHQHGNADGKNNFYCLGTWGGQKFTPQKEMKK